MPGTGDYIGPNKDSTYLFDVVVALDQLKDNSNELIDPKDIRDSVWTLWNRIDDVQITASQSLVIAASNSYTNPNKTTVTVGGVAAGTTFGGSYSMQQMFDLILYPYSAPALSLAASGTPRQFGDSLNTTLSWSVTKKSNTILTIDVDGTTIAPTGDSQSGTVATVATHSLSYASNVQEVDNFTMTVGEGSTYTTSASVTWRHKIYWGIVDLSTVPSYPNPNLTDDFAAVVPVGNFIDSDMVKGLTGAGIGIGNQLATTYVKTYNGINAQGYYLAFAHPTIFGASPNFEVNGLPNTAFTKVWNAQSFVNEFGLSLNYDVWVSNTAQNSPITLFQIK